MAPCIVFVLLTTASFYAAHGRDIQTPILWRDDIPPLCLNSSVTPVSCTDAVVGPDGLLPHPDDCHLFYYCIAPGYPPVCRQCPADLHFSPTEHVCDTPEHAGCQTT